MSLITMKSKLETGFKRQHLFHSVWKLNNNLSQTEGGG